MVHGSDGRVEFSFYRPQAHTVYLAGDFNHWRPSELLMSRQEDGYWKAWLELPPGSYRFRYCADGQWYTDFAAFGVEPGKYGFDSVVRVEEPRATQPKAKRRAKAARAVAA
jgi:1,4-alpha-glucan branching enzyme